MPLHDDSQAEETTPPPEQEGVWCIVANVAERQIFGEEHEAQLGTRHFSPNTKVYCFPPQWGDGYEKIKVLGRHRGSSKLVTLIMPSKRLTNWRAKYVYHPFVVEQMKPGWERGSAESMVVSIRLGESANKARLNGFEHETPNDALIFAARLRLPEEAERALQRGADVNARWGEYTPLWLATAHGSTETIKVLLANGADTTIASNGVLPVQLAAGHPEHEKLLRSTV